MIFTIPWIIEPPAGQLRVANATTTQFTANLMKEVSSMFPSKLFSTGGDELNTNCYINDGPTQQDLGRPFSLKWYMKRRS